MKYSEWFNKLDAKSINILSTSEKMNYKEQALFVALKIAISKQDVPYLG